MRPDSIDLATPNEITRFLAEDLGPGDITANIVPVSTLAAASVITRQTMVLCGCRWFNDVFHFLDKALKIEWTVSDGETVAAGAELCTLHGPARALLTGERTALNIIQALSATATISRQYADAVTGCNAQILDTRKTIPGLRMAQKYAVRCGGCRNHRFGLYDGVLIKENHIIAAGSIANAVLSAKSSNPGVPVEVEVESLDELAQAIRAGADRVLLDNFTVELLCDAVRENRGRVELEASGNVSLENVREIAETGVDFISIGALTKDIKAIDLSMRIQFLK